MEILLRRIARKPKYTIGKLYVDGNYVCDTIEDLDRGLDNSMTVEQILKKKVKSETAIPTGRYQVTLNVISPKFSKKEFYQINANKGRVPRLLNVKGFEGILMHCGTDQNSSAGCIILGENKVVGKVINSQATFIKFYNILKTAKDKIYITIK